MENTKFKNLFKNIKKAFEEVTYELLDEEYYEDNSCKPIIQGEKAIAVIIGITGTCKGRILLMISNSTAAKITEKMNYGPLSDQLEFYLHLGEFGNIVSGRAITYINNHFEKGAIRLAPPAIFAARNLDIITPNIHIEDITYQGILGPVWLNIGFEGVG